MRKSTGEVALPHPCASGSSSLEPPPGEAERTDGKLRQGGARKAGPRVAYLPSPTHPHSEADKPWSAQGADPRHSLRGP